MSPSLLCAFNLHTFAALTSQKARTDLSNLNFDFTAVSTNEKANKNTKTTWGSPFQLFYETQLANDSNNY